MFSKSRDDQRRRIGDRAAADRLSPQAISGLRRSGPEAISGDDADHHHRNHHHIYNSTEIGDDAAGIVDIATNVIPSQTLS